MKRSLLAFAALLFAAAAGAQTAGADYPSKTVKIVVPFTAGSATDIMARVVGERLSASTGQAVVVENRPGAGGTLGSAQVARSEPDGYTLLVVSTGHVVNPTLYPGLGYDTVGDFAGVSPLAALPSVLVVGAGSPIKSVAELIAAAKDKPGQLNYASAGVGSATHVNAEKFRSAAGIQVTHIPFKGTPEILSNTMGAQVQMAWVPLVSSVGALKDSRITALAVSTKVRSAALPDVPTIAEAGFPGGQFDFWVGMLAPAKTPREVVARINAEINRSQQTPDIKARLSKLGADSMPMTPDQFDAYIQDEANVLQKIMRAAGAKPG